MNKKDAYKQAKKDFPLLEPVSPAGYTTSEGIVEISLLDCNQVLVVHHPTDIYRLRTACEIVIRELESKKKK